MVRTSIAFLVALTAVARADAPARAGGPTPDGDGDTEVGVDLAATGNLERGLIRQDVVTARAIASIRSGPWSAFVQPYWLYADVNDKTTAHELYVRTIGFRALDPTWFAFAAAVYDHSFRREIAHRGLGGGGAGATVAHWNGGTIVASLGVLGEAAELVGGGRRSTVRGSARLYGRYELGRLSIVHDIFVMPSLLASPDLRVVFEGGLDLAIVGGLAGRVAVDASHEDVIVAGTRHDDLAVTFGLSYHLDAKP